MRTTARLIAMASTLVLTTACVIGSRATPSASGMTIEVRAPSGLVRTGELLATNVSGAFYLDQSDRVVFTGFSNGIEVRNTPGWPRVRIRGLPDAANLEKLRVNSRYPLSLDDETVIRFLAARGQTEPDVWP